MLSKNLETPTTRTSWQCKPLQKGGYMSQPIANINGRNVYSDKRVKSIVNTGITFTDGSWCNVATGEVVNNGGGYISIGTPPNNDGEKTTFGPKTYRATALDVQSLRANVDIQPIDEQEMTVTINGQKSTVDDINVRLQGDTLIIEGKNSDGNIHGANIVIGGGRNIGSISVGGGNITIGGNRIFSSQSTIVMSDGGEEDAKVSIGIPRGSAVKIAGIQGDVTIGDTNGSLHASILGGSDIKAGKVSDAMLSIQGSGDINVSAVNGNLSMNIQGSGDIHVHGGSVDLLSANIMGSGDAGFDGEAVDACLSIMGSGDINIASVRNKPSRSVMGRGKINIGNWR